MSADMTTVVLAYAAVVLAVAGYGGYLLLCQARLERRMEEIRRIRAARASGRAAG